MGEVIIKKWKCDRCGLVQDKRPYGSGRAHYEVRVSVDYETAGGNIIQWNEMCAPCDAIVQQEVDAMQASARADYISRTSPTHQDGEGA